MEKISRLKVKLILAKTVKARKILNILGIGELLISAQVELWGVNVSLGLEHTETVKVDVLLILDVGNMENTENQISKWTQDR